MNRFIVVLRWTDFSPWNFRSADGFTFSSRLRLENISVLHCYSFFSRGCSCFSPRPGLCGAARRAMEFLGRDIPCLCREVCSIRGQICAKSQPQRISGKALPPRNFGFPARGRLCLPRPNAAALTSESSPRSPQGRSGAGTCKPVPASVFRWSAAACRHRPGACHEPEADHCR